MFTRPISTQGARDLDALPLDRTIRHWQAAFRNASQLLTGLLPDVRIGDAPGSALLFNMERLFETVLGRRIRRECQTLAECKLSVALQGPQTNLAASGFQLRPDISITHGDGVQAILDAKWKRLEKDKPNSGVASVDAYQMNAYADRYRCNRLALVYPATAPGRVTSFVLMTAARPVLDVLTIDVRELALGNGMPAGFDAVLSSTGGEAAAIPAVGFHFGTMAVSVDTLCDPRSTNGEHNRSFAF
ncbi:hypothetical protein RWA03_25490 (plasmid) [Sinorhizobium meliloti]|uniref:5-methylcytosine restriction system specificity protein McrC n=1 Tax=Rhizobium meliloti TaxID=382 RepID=UPI003DA159A7